MASRAANYPFKCNMCDEAYRFEFHLNAHILRHADANAGVAMTQQPREQSYLLKEVSPNPDYPFRCSVCRAFFSEEDNLKSHFETLHLNIAPHQAQELSKQGQFKAQNKTLGQFKAQNKPLGQFKAKNKTLGQFKAQNKTLGQFKSQNKTMGQFKVPSMPQGQFKAVNHAPGQFNNLTNLQEEAKAGKEALGHLKALHSQKLKSRFPCPHCPSTFARPTYLSLHVNHIHRRHGHPCPAPGCPFIGRHPNTLKSHLAVSHSIERPFPCDQCPMRFGRLSDLQRHLNAVHLQLLWPKIVSVYSLSSA